MRYQIPKPSSNIPGTPGLLQSFVFPQSQPVRRSERQMPTAIPVSLLAGGAITQDTYLFPVSQPLNRRSFQVVPKGHWRSGAIRDVSSVFPVSALTIQPDRTQSSAWLDGRYRQLSFVAPQIVVPTAQPAITLFDYQQPSRRQGYQVVPRVVPRFGATTTAPPTDVYFIANAIPPNRYGVRPAPRLIVRNITGVTAGVPNLPTVLDQPSAAWWKGQATAYRLQGATSQLTGSTTQATYLYPPNQPDRRGWYVPRLAQFSSPSARTEGTPTVASYVFTLDQPARLTISTLTARNAETTKQLTGVFTPPATQQSYVFEPNQPSRNFWYVPRRASEQAKVTPALETTAIPIVPTLLNQPTRGWAPEDQRQMPARIVTEAINNIIYVFNAAWAKINTYLGPSTGEPDDT